MKKYLGVIIIDFILIMFLFVYIDRKLSSYYRNYSSSLENYYLRQTQEQEIIKNNLNNYNENIIRLQNVIKQNFKPNNYSGKTVQDLANEFKKRGF